METKKFNVYIIVKTGLHIWAWNENVWIGELDNSIIKDREWMPYIPWSSLKWKLRSLYELKENKIWHNWWPYEFCQGKNWSDWWGDGDNLEIYDEISMFFGKSWKETNHLENLWPTRFIFRDLKLAKKEDIENLDIKNFAKEDLYVLEDYESWQQEWQPLTEEKMEVSINRETWTAWSGQFSPRTVERVFVWTVFKWELIVRLFKKPTEEKEKENLKKFWENFEKLKKLLENDYLWGMWTRGSGQVEIIFEEIKENW